jgi:peptidoglycan hydrolase-like protein with peptidoglycan-binding domain
VTIMIKSKAFSDATWKDIVAKNKSVKDNGLLNKLAEVRKLGEDDHVGAQKALDEIVKLVAQLKKSKEISATPAAARFVAELSGAAESALKDAAKAKAEADKKAKAEADEAKKRESEEQRKGKDEGEDEDDPSGLLTTKLIPLLRGVNKGEMMHVLVARAGKQVAVMLSRKPIAPARRKILADELGVSGGVKYFNGHCVKEEGTTTFVMKSEVAGLAKQLKLALLNQTGMRVKRLSCRGEDGDDHDLEEGDDEGLAVARVGGETPEPPKPGDEPPTAMTRPFELSAAVGRGGKNLEEDVKQVQIALNRRADAGLKVDGRCGKDTIEAIMEFQRALGQSRPDGRVDPNRGTARALAASGKVGKPPPPPSPMAPPEDLGEPTIARAPQVWHGTRNILDHNINELKRAIRQEYSSEHPALLAEIDQNVQRVDVILEKLDTRLAQTLERAGAAKSPAQRNAEIAAAKTILADYVAFVKEEPLIDHIDKNPFGVDAQVRKTITNSLTHMIKSIS